MVQKTSKIRVNQINILLWFIILVGLAVRLWRLWDPNSYLYDESYYAQYALDWLRHIPYMDVHPAVGDTLIALGIKMFGNNSFGWRFMPFVAGVLMIPLSYYIATKIFKNVWVGLLTAFLVAIDGLMIVQSRFALLNIFVALFVALSYFGTIKFLETKKWYWLVALTVSFGLAISTQWTAAPFGAVLFIWIIVGLWRSKRMLWPSLLLMLIMPAVVYFCSFLLLDHEGKNCLAYFTDWHVRSWTFHAHLAGDHVNASRWYTWLWLYNPPWYAQAVGSNEISLVLAHGNPVIWWSGILSLLYCIAMFFASKRVRKVIIIPLLSFLIFYLGWSVISREQFLYYIAPALPFYFMMLAYVLAGLARYAKVVVIAWICAVILCFIFFYPLYVGRTISTNYYNKLMWFNMWRPEVGIGNAVFQEKTVQ